MRRAAVGGSDVNSPSLDELFKTHFGASWNFIEKLELRGIKCGLSSARCVVDSDKSEASELTKHMSSTKFNKKHCRRQKCRLASFTPFLIGKIVWRTCSESEPAFYVRLKRNFEFSSLQIFNIMCVCGNVRTKNWNSDYCYDSDNRKYLIFMDDEKVQTKQTLRCWWLHRG